ncbi:hypothetical protein HDV05_002122, partial [Chytridiales sp. JEL 0842]
MLRGSASRSIGSLAARRCLGASTSRQTLSHNAISSISASCRAASALTGGRALFSSVIPNADRSLKVGSAGSGSLAGRGFASSAISNAATSTRSLLEPLDTFPRRHIGPSDADIAEMCKVIGVKDLDELVKKTVPDSITIQNATKLGPGMSEIEVLQRLKYIAQKNKVLKSFIGMGYASAVTPFVILRNIMENPAWYTQYTPYQPEISQGRLESLINYQTMVQDMTGLPIANASLLDEATAASEAMLMCFSAANRKKTVFFVDERTYPQTLAL